MAVRQWQWQWQWNSQWQYGDPTTSTVWHMGGTVDTGQININSGYASMGNNHDGELGMDLMDAPLCSRRMFEMRIIEGRQASGNGDQVVVSRSVEGRCCAAKQRSSRRYRALRGRRGVERGRWLCDTRHARVPTPRDHGRSHSQCVDYRTRSRVRYGQPRMTPFGHISRIPNARFARLAMPWRTSKLEADGTCAAYAYIMESPYCAPALLPYCHAASPPCTYMP